MKVVTLSDLLESRGGRSGFAGCGDDPPTDYQRLARRIGHFHLVELSAGALVRFQTQYPKVSLRLSQWAHDPELVGRFATGILRSACEEGGVVITMSDGPPMTAAVLKDEKERSIILIN